MPEKCTECGCICARCIKNDNKHMNDVHLHEEIEYLRQSLMEKNTHIVKIETQFLNEADKFPNGELASLREEIHTWKEKYTRLYEAHKRIQKINQNLEDKLLRIVDKCETEKGAFTKDIATLSHRLADANYTIHRLSQDNSKYRNDVNLAIQLLQCKPSNFVGQKYDSLPNEMQAKVRNYVAQKRRPSGSDQSFSDVKSITVPISTFPPTAMVYNITKASIDKHSDDDSDNDKPPVNIVSAAIMAKVLEDRERERIFAKHCDTCVCHKSIFMVDSESQTMISYLTENSLDVNNKMYTTRKIDDIKHPRANNTGMCTIKDQMTPTRINIERELKENVIGMMKQNKPNKQIEIDSDTGLNRRCDQPMSGSSGATPIEIINDRIWKNNWTHSKFDNSGIYNDTDNKHSSGFDFDVINERIWKNDVSNSKNVNQITVIEVTNVVNAEHPISDMTTSPSFSGESVLISTSEPSSSSSDLVQSLNEKGLRNDSTNKERSTGPKNSFVRICSDGSKNILLDNAGHYETVLYTNPESGSGSAKQTNTALVHNTIKATRLTRSSSTSSDEVLPILSHNGTQLQRVAEWVQSSLGVAKDVKSALKIDIASPVSPNVREQSHKRITPRSPIVRTPLNEGRGLATGNLTMKTYLFEVSGEQRENSVISSTIEQSDIAKSELEIQDLITFDSNNDDGPAERRLGDELLLSNCTNTDYEIQITKEMEDTYLKLAASFDPVSLRVSSGSNTDLTIEKYREHHKRIQLPRNNQKSERTT